MAPASNKVNNSGDEIGEAFKYTIFNFRQAKDESCNNFLKHFLDLSSSLKISGIDAKTNTHLTDMKYKKLIKLDPNKSTTLANKEAVS